MPRPTALLLAFAAGCQSELQLVHQTQLDLFTQVPNDKVDILFVVDDSSSMAEEQEALAAGFESFARTLQAAGRSWQAGVVSTSLPEDGHARLLGPVVRPDRSTLEDFRAQVRVGTEGSTQEQGLEAAASAVSPEMLAGDNAGLLRDDALLLVVFVTDEEDCSDGGALAGSDVGKTCYSRKEELVPITTFLPRYAEAKGGDLGQVLLTAIVGRDRGTCATALPGRRYIDLAHLTGGMVGDICSADWSGMLGELGLVASGIREAFELSEDAMDGTLDVLVGGVPVPSSPTDGWTLEGPRTLRFHGDAVPARGAEIVVEYVVAPGS